MTGDLMCMRDGSGSAWHTRRTKSAGAHRQRCGDCAQLMSELVRKAEADIDSLRRRLAGLGAAGEPRL